MSHVNIEIKARCRNQEKIRTYLRDHGADHKGTDHQIDTYFKVPKGRLKLREGVLENYLIFYEREEEKGPKESNVILYEFDPASSLKDILTRTLQVLTVVDKKREIYFIDNVKFHIDMVESLGAFVEIEARDPEGVIGNKELQKQCEQYQAEFGIENADTISASYSDLILAQATK